MSLKRFLSGFLLLSVALMPLMAAPQPGSQQQAAQQTGVKGSAKQAKQKETATNSVHQDEGQRVFEQNCSRCHTAPDGFSSRISGTVLRHMRVRASLSRHDEEELLHFLNP
jgi:mono/diheme cytochrome c family protein